MDTDGFVTFDEIKRAFMGPGEEVSQKELDEVAARFKRLDVDQDEKINLAAFIEFLQSHNTEGEFTKVRTRCALGVRWGVHRHSRGSDSTIA
mgnify:CR=1 FL=1